MTIKRQPVVGGAIAREFAVFEMFRASLYEKMFSMHSNFVASLKGTEYMYMVMESCSTSLCKLLLRRSEEMAQLLPPRTPQHYVLGIVRGAGHLHKVGVAHGDVSLSNVLLTWGAHC